MRKFFAWVKSLFSRKGSSTLIPVTSMSNPWGYLYSINMPSQPRLEGNQAVVELAEGREVDMVVKTVGPPLTGKKAIFSWSFDGTIYPTQGTVPTASLIVIRKGNTWQGDNTQMNYRWYWQGPRIIPGSSDRHEVPFEPSYWFNVWGKKNDEGFADALANAEYIGVAFGDPGAGATAHGCKGSGTFKFTLEVI